MKEITLTQLAAIMVSLTEALDRNTNALLSQQGQPMQQEKPVQEAVKEDAEETKEAPVEAAEDKSDDSNDITLDVVQAALLDVKAKHGADAAKAILKEVAGVATVKRTPEDKYQAVIDACAAKMEEDVVEEKEEEPVTPKHSLDDVKAAAKDLGALGRTWLEKAKEIIAEVGGAAKTADVPAENYDKLYEALVSAKEAAEAEAEADL
jgi:hypothetical protein|nr:MAG TPA: hypothetical protein [Caudoviricetes sp.]